jgi:hypothetical protein
MILSDLHDVDIQRRGALKALAFGGLGLATPAMAATDSGLNINFSDPKENLKAFTRVFSDIDPKKIAVGWYAGTVYSVVGDSSKVVPLLGVEGIGVRRTLPLESGGYRVFNRELAFYKDLKTGAFIDAWDNPMNGEKVETFPIQNMFVNADTAPIFEFDMEGTKIRQPFNPPWTVTGDWAMSLFEIHQSVKSELKPAEWPRESPGEFTRISEMFQRHARVADLNNPELTSVPTVGSWTRIASWFPWMLMGQAEGHLYFRCQTQKFGGISELPKAFLAKAEKGYAQYLEAPPADSWGKQPNDSTFNMYKRLRKPAPPKSQG